MAKQKHANPTEVLDPERPFLGLRSFEEVNQSQFGGRDKEIDELFDLVEDHFLTVVFGDSGIGKTSLIKAGLIPKLRKNFYYPIYSRIDFSDTKPPLKQLRDRIYTEMKALDDSISELKSETLWEYMHEVNLLNGIVTPVLILDQFEELFTLGKSNEGINEFVVELGDLAQNRIPAAVKSKYKKLGKTVPSRYSGQNYHIVLSLREDYLARLDELKNHIPSIMNNGFRVVQMTVSQALEAAIKPGKGLIDEPVAIEIIKKLPGVSQADFDLLNQKGEEKQALKVEPFLLSLICDRLNEERIKQNLKIINKKIVEDFNVDDVIKSFYNETLKDFDPNVELAIENLLLDNDGFRKLQPLKEFQSEYNISDADIVRLVNSRIVRQERRNNVDYLELIHDVLKDIIKKKRDKRERVEQYKKEKEEREAQIRENEAKAKKNSQRAILVIIVIFLGFVGYYVYNYYNNKEKETNIWVIAKQIPNDEGFNAYLKTYPKGEFKQEALKGIDTFYWNKAVRDTTYFRRNRFDIYATKAKSLKETYDYNAENAKNVEAEIKKIDQINNLESDKDRDAWKTADNVKTFDGYLEYIMNTGYKKKEHLAEAVDKVKEKGISGWLYGGKLKNSLMDTDVDEFFKIVWRKDAIGLTSNAIPVRGDVIENTGRTRFTYKLLQLLNKENNRNKAWQKNTRAYVSSIVLDGNTLIMQIIYKEY